MHYICTGEGVGNPNFSKIEKKIQTHRKLNLDPIQKKIVPPHDVKLLFSEKSPTHNNVALKSNPREQTTWREGGL